MVIGGLDIGTTGCKLTVFDESGKYLDKAYRDYPAKRGTTTQTLDVTALREGVFEVIREIAGRHPDLAGFGVTSFGETFVMTGADGEPIAPALLYTDPHGTEQSRALEEKLGGRHITEISGVRPHAMYSLPKLMWVKENHPELFAQAKHVFLMEDYVVWLLTGKAQIDYSLATRTMAFDIRSRTWSEEIFAAAGIDPSLFSEPVPTGTTAGCITAEAAAATGLSPECQVMSVSHDQVAAAVGAGVFTSDTAVDGAGTVECLTPIYDSIPDMGPMYDGYFAVVPYVIPGKYVCYAFQSTGGALMQWCIDTLAKKEKEEAKALGISPNRYMEEQYEKELDAMADGKDAAFSGPSGMLVLPHFAGSTTPYMDTGSKGAFVGVTAATTAADMYRGCMEGIVYEMMLNVEHLKPSGINFHHLRATGGGAHSEVWMQMKADALNMSITSLKTLDAGTVGCAMMTGMALGCFKDLQDAADHMVVRMKTYRPDPDRHAAFASVYNRYRGLYNAVRPLV